MVSGYFGVPGCGKSTFLAMIAIRELKKIRKGRSRYQHVLTNFPVQGCEKVSIRDLGFRDIEDSLILFDEITLDADSRDFKQFAQSTKEFFTLHRHVNNDIVYFCQDYSRVDKTIRNVTYDLWYLTKSNFPFFRHFTKARRIFRNININEYNSELTLGYRFAKFFEVIFSFLGGAVSKRCFRPKWYKYFDSYDKLQLDNLPPFKYESW